MPHLTAYIQENLNHPWELKSDMAELFFRDDTINFLGNVEGWQYADVDEKRQLTTPKLTFHPEKKLLKTDKEIVIRSREGVTTATGMTANFATQVYTLSSNVKGQYRAH